MILVSPTRLSAGIAPTYELFRRGLHLARTARSSMTACTMHRACPSMSMGCCSSPLKIQGGYWNLWGTSPGNYSLWVGRQLQLPDRGERNSEVWPRCAGIVDLGNDAHRIRWAGLCELSRVAKDSRGPTFEPSGQESSRRDYRRRPPLGSASRKITNPDLSSSATRRSATTFAVTSAAPTSPLRSFDFH